MLLDHNGPAQDGWVRAPGPQAANVPAALVGWDDLAAALATLREGNRLGVEIANNLDLALLRPFLPHLSLIAIRFPGFADGRGFSLARVLRRQGFDGTLRAAGPLIADQFADALACGFDEIEIPDVLAARQPAAHWQAALGRISGRYQGSYGATATILDRRRAASPKEPAR